ncbi:MAG: hypothetical protein KatS3mg104_1418 [Phycisphaerae bacterium]|jgi:hypothetical protein|nr:MAG: hypothetical protein KatS3mg104_1418 [Phycisphaerae bacterium]
MLYEPRVLARTSRKVPFLWKPIGPYAYGDPTWCAVEIGPDVLDRRADHLLLERLERLGRVRCDLLIVQELDSSDVKTGWPIHRLLQMRDRGLCSFFAIETTEPLEAEWIALNTPFHALVIPYLRQQMDVRFRVFRAAEESGVALLARASCPEDLALQHATPEIVASLTELDPDELPVVDPEAVWKQYQQDHPAPPRLRSGHPPETGA